MTEEIFSEALISFREGFGKHEKCKKLFLVLSIFIASSCTSISNTREADCKSIDYVKLNIGQLEASEVSICGFLKYEFEDKNLYGSVSAARKYSNEKCISLGLREGVSIDLSVLNNRKVMVRGEVAGDFCPEETICMSSCSKVGVFVHTVSALD